MGWGSLGVLKMIVLYMKDFNLKNRTSKTFTLMKDVNDARKLLIKCCHSKHIYCTGYTYDTLEEDKEISYWFDKQFAKWH